MNSTIEFIIFPDALGLDITGPLEVFSTATKICSRNQTGKAGYSSRFTARRQGPVKLSSGIQIVADTSFNNPPEADTLLIPGGNGARSMINDTEFMDYIQMRSCQARRIISVCNGAFILAAAGLLDGKKATTHWMIADELARNYPGITVESEAIYTRDGNIYTSAGVTAGIDLALSVVEEDLGVSVALDVSRALVIYYRRPGSQSQFSAPLKAQETAGKRFSKLHNWLLKNLTNSISVEQMAHQSAMSQRNFARVFKTQTGMTPNRYLETLRLDKARELLCAGNESIETTAEISGFGREERLRRAFLRRYGLTPSQYRLHFIQSSQKGNV